MLRIRIMKRDMMYVYRIHISEINTDMTVSQDHKKKIIYIINIVASNDYHIDTAGVIKNTGNSIIPVSASPKLHKILILCNFLNRNNRLLFI